VGAGGEGVGGGGAIYARMDKGERRGGRV